MTSNGRRVDCRDLAGRRAQLIVLGDHGRVILVTAGGETAVLTPPQVGQLRAAFRDSLLETTDTRGNSHAGNRRH